MGLSEGEVVNVPFPLCEADDSERKSVYVCWLLCRCALKLGSTHLGQHKSFGIRDDVEVL